MCRMAAPDGDGQPCRVAVPDGYGCRMAVPDGDGQVEFEQ